MPTTPNLRQPFPQAPLKSTTLEIYSGKTGGKSGASTALVAAAVGAVGAAAAVVLL